MKKTNPVWPVTPFIPKGVILDMDGLMIDTEQLEIRIYVKISRDIGWPTPETVLCNTIGVSDADSEEFYKNKYGADYPFREIWAAVKKEVTKEAEKNGIPHRPGLLVMLDKLDKLGIPTAVATSTFRERARWKLERAGVLDRFKILVCGDEIERGKPEPDIFLLAAERLGEKPEDCVGFEDSPAGLAGLAAAGISSVFIKDMAEPSPEILSTVWRSCADLEEAALLFGSPQNG